MKKLFVLVLILLSSIKAGAISDFYSDQKRGWFWFEDTTQNKQLETEEVTPKSANLSLERIKKGAD